MRDFLGPFKSVVIVMFWGILAFWRPSWNDFFLLCIQGCIFGVQGCFHVVLGASLSSLGGHLECLWDILGLPWEVIGLSFACLLAVASHPGHLKGLRVGFSSVLCMIVDGFMFHYERSWSGFWSLGRL